MSHFQWYLFGLVVCNWVTPFSSGSVKLHCKMTVKWRDLRGQLHWDCPDHKPNTTYTVQKRTQGDDRWQAVGGCVRVTGRSCDVSRAFEEINLYNWIRLGREDSLGSVLWSRRLLSNPLAETTYSAPSLSLSLQELILMVNVTLGCSPITDCPPKDCCPFSDLDSGLCATITVYRETRLSMNQTHQKCGKEKVSYEFTGLAPGRRYCAVGNITTSPASSPQCIDLPAVTERPLWLLVVVFFILILTFLVTYGLRLLWTSTKTHLPRPLESLRSGEPMEVGVPRENSPEDFGGDHISILSQCPPESCCDLTPPASPVGQTIMLSHGDGYCSNHLPVDSGSDRISWDSMELGDVLESCNILQCTAVPGLLEVQMEPQTHPGHAGMLPDPLETPLTLDNTQGCRAGQSIPLCLVQMGGCEEEGLQDVAWFSLENNPQQRIDYPAKSRPH
ncbi:hypothetical protein GJAV_G00168380 [Gymnothorax javanicus]|nr:hypothetical protein GJAV_G00168380 [Gymnothorax javanicus]